MLLVHEKYQSSFDVAMKCAVECEHCAEACMGNPDMQLAHSLASYADAGSLVKCARTCLDCAEICRTISTYMVRGSRFIPNLTKACAEICTACAEECSFHDMDHCNKCAQACREAVEEYQKITAVAA